jgi:selenocysteine lyase/cysteine desulfurase
VSVPLRGAEPAPLLARLKRSRVACAARDGNLRMSIHFYNHEDDIDRLTRALVER